MHKTNQLYITSLKRLFLRQNFWTTSVLCFTDVLRVVCLSLFITVTQAELRSESVSWLEYCKFAQFKLSDKSLKLYIKWKQSKHGFLFRQARISSFLGCPVTFRSCSQIGIQCRDNLFQRIVDQSLCSVTFFVYKTALCTTSRHLSIYFALCLCARRHRHVNKVVDQ